MPIPGEIQQFHGRQGEAATGELLSRRFWYLWRSVDIEGGDFLVQIRSDSLESMDSRKPELFILGIVQSKFLQVGSSAYVKQHYCTESDGNPAKHFFLLCHMLDDKEERHSYFFTAEDIVNSLPFDEEKAAYKLYIGAGEKYESCKNLPAKLILDSIEKGILETKAHRTNQLVRTVFFNTINAGRNHGYSTRYLFRWIEGVAVCITENSETGNQELLEPRRDLFGSIGGYRWGYRGSGPQFLAWSLLAHVYDGDVPNRRHVIFIVDWLLDALPSEVEWDIPSELIHAMLAGLIPTISETQKICSRSKTSQERKKKLSREGILAELHRLNERRGIANLDQILSQGPA
ncbi:DUF6166 domain-containing protein [Comamonas sp. GB3 AK4-5]|uniref:DUF6166 domain-containing protein n=1 Tax=Comamonas sp. GB3 AK4-5 TaxID=3231487 RepID=UPI00351F5D20